MTEHTPFGTKLVSRVWRHYSFVFLFEFYNNLVFQMRLFSRIVLQISGLSIQ